MTMPTQEAQRSRETSMQAERHWWIQRLQHIVDRWEDPDVLMDTQDCLAALEKLIAERTK